MSFFANLFSKKLDVDLNIMLHRLWGDCYYDAKQKKFFKNAVSKLKKPCFVQFILDNIWHIYNAFQPKLDFDQQVISKIYKFIGVEIKNEISITKDNCKLLVKEFMRNWLPVYDAVISAIIKHHPSPCDLSKDRIMKLMSNDHCSYDQLSLDSQSLMKDFLKCSSDQSAPIIVFVSKMILINDKESINNFNNPVMPMPFSLIDKKSETLKFENLQILSKLDENDKKTRLVAFARIFSGTLSLLHDNLQSKDKEKQQELYVLMPKYRYNENILLNDLLNEENTKLQHQSGGYALKVKIKDLYLMMGIHLEKVQSVPAGNIVAIGGLENVILKSATISSTLKCPTFSSMSFYVNPIVKICIEPESYKEMTKMSKALETLVLADPNLEYKIEDSGINLNFEIKIKI